MKILNFTFVLLALSLFTTNVSGQCTPDLTYTSLGAHPTILDDAMTNQLYSDTVTIVVPKDTIISGFTIPLDSALIKSVITLPAGLTSTCMTPSCKIYPTGANLIYSCLTIDGIPSTPVNNQSIGIIVDFWATIPFLGGTTYTDTFNVFMTVNGPPVGIISDEEFMNRISISPNPTSENIIVRNLSDLLEYQFELFDLKGQLLKSWNITGKQTDIIELANYPVGNYYLNIQDPYSSVTKKVVVTR